MADAKSMRRREPEELNDPATRGRRPRLAVFGGSFDPIHNGHLFLAGELLRKGLADEVLFVPARLPPHKTLASLAPPDHRLAMLRLAVEHEPAFTVTDLELQRVGVPSYTIDTLEILSGVYPGSDLSFAMGMDSLADIHTWSRAPELIARYTFLVYPRPGIRPPAFATLAGHFGPRLAQKLLDGVVEAALMPISSTEVRALSANGKSLAGLVPAAVADYIKTRELYRTPQTEATQQAW